MELLKIIIAIIIFFLLYLHDWSIYKRGKRNNDLMTMFWCGLLTGIDTCFILFITYIYFN